MIYYSYLANIGRGSSWLSFTKLTLGINESFLIMQHITWDWGYCYFRGLTTSHDLSQNFWNEKQHTSSISIDDVRLLEQIYSDKMICVAGEFLKHPKTEFFKIGAFIASLRGVFTVKYLSLHWVILQLSSKAYGVTFFIIFLPTLMCHTSENPFFLLSLKLVHCVFTKKIAVYDLLNQGWHVWVKSHKLLSVLSKKESQWRVTKVDIWHSSLLASRLHAYKQAL